MRSRCRWWASSRTPARFACRASRCSRRRRKRSSRPPLRRGPIGGRARTAEIAGSARAGGVGIAIIAVEDKGEKCVGHDSVVPARRSRALQFDDSKEGSMRMFAQVSLALLIAGCATYGTTSNSDADAYIRAAEPRFITAFNAGNADAVAGFYADDAVVLGPNAPIARGTAAIRDAFRGMTGGHPTLSFAPDRIVQSGDVAYEYGHYTMQMGPNADQGNYVTVWRRQSNGDWKIVADSVNTSLP